MSVPILGLINAGDTAVSPAKLETIIEKSKPYQAFLQKDSKKQPYPG